MFIDSLSFYPLLRVYPMRDRCNLCPSWLSPKSASSWLPIATVSTTPMCLRKSTQGKSRGPRGPGGLVYILKSSLFGSGSKYLKPLQATSFAHFFSFSPGPPCPWGRPRRPRLELKSSKDSLLKEKRNECLWKTQLARLSAHAQQ